MPLSYPELSRPLYPYTDVARYRGEGYVKKWQSFERVIP